MSEDKANDVMQDIFVELSKINSELRHLNKNLEHDGNIGGGNPGGLYVLMREILNELREIKTIYQSRC